MMSLEEIKKYSYTENYLRDIISHHIPTERIENIDYDKNPNIQAFFTVYAKYINKYINIFGNFDNNLPVDDIVSQRYGAKYSLDEIARKYNVSKKDIENHISKILCLGYKATGFHLREQFRRISKL